VEDGAGAVTCQADSSSLDFLSSFSSPFSSVSHTSSTLDTEAAAVVMEDGAGVMEEAVVVEVEPEVAADMADRTLPLQSKGKRIS